MSFALQSLPLNFNIETDLPDQKQLEAYFTLHEKEISSISEISRVYLNESVPDQSGQSIKIIPGAIAPDQGYLLFYLVRKLRPLVTLETGFGYGMSACFMLTAHKLNSIGSVHVSIDPHFRHWTKGVGLYTLERLGLADSHLLIERESSHVLPRLKLPKKEKKLQLSFIDGNHLFDRAMVDFFFIDQLTQPEGLIVFDDVSSPALTALLNFIAANRRDYRLLRPNPRTIICQKIGRDKRPWDHYRPFEASTGHDWGRTVAQNE